MRRKERKIRKLRGMRTAGRGNTKHGRGKGSHMGRGSAQGGRNILHIYKYEPERISKISKVGFHSLYKPLKAINLKDLAKYDNEVNILDLGYEKVLGGGKIDKPLIIKAKAFTAKAKEKIEKAGGKAILI
ncbi:MAG: uL15 family ribosomal protein [archaeon]